MIPTDRFDPKTLPAEQRSWLRKSNIPVRFWGIDRVWIANTGTIADKTAAGWFQALLAGQVIKSPGNLGVTGKGLLITGPPGLGKTTLACAMLQDFTSELFKSELAPKDILRMSSATYGIASTPIYYLTYPQLIQKIKATFDSQVDMSTKCTLEGLYGRSKNDTDNVRVLVLDDLGKEYGTQFTASTFDDLIRSRYDCGLPTIITSNVDVKDWGSKYGEPMKSFAEEAFVTIRMSGSDLRKKS